MNPTCDHHKEPFETIDVTETFSCKAIEIRSGKFKPLHQSQTPYSSGVFAWKYICLSSFQFVSFLKLVEFPLHCTQMYISFTRLTKDIDFGH